MKTGDQRSLLGRFDDWLIAKAKQSEENLKAARMQQRFTDLKDLGAQSGDLSDADLMSRVAAMIRGDGEKRVAELGIEAEMIRRLSQKQKMPTSGPVQALLQEIPRGPMGAERGVRENLNHQIANQAWVRRGVLPLGVVGGATLAGKALMDLGTAIGVSDGPSLAIALGSPEDVEAARDVIPLE